MKVGSGVVAAVGGVVGLLLLGRSSTPSPLSEFVNTTPFGPPPPPRLRRASGSLYAAPAPPITMSPNKRYLSDIEKGYLSEYIPQVDLDSTVLHFSTPASSFASEDKNVNIIAVTTPLGIFLRWPNHAIATPAEFSILGHELFHVGQQRMGLVTHGDTPELELPAYQMGVTISQDLEAKLAQIEAADRAA